MGWKRQAEKCCEILEQLDKLFQEVDDLHSESDAELSQRTVGSEPGNRVWWAQLLLDHTRQIGIRRPHCELPRRVVSCCSGGCSEAFALKDLSVVRLIHAESRTSPKTHSPYIPVLFGVHVVFRETFVIGLLWLYPTSRVYARIPPGAGHSFHH